MTHTWHLSAPNGTAALETALSLARLAVKAHGAATSADTARELLAVLLTASAATGGAVALTHSDEGTQRRAPTLLAAQDIDATRVVAWLMEAECGRGPRQATTGRTWAQAVVPLGEQGPPPRDGAGSRDADTALVVFQWDGVDAQEQRERGEALIAALRDPIAAVVVSMLASEGRIELERRANAPLGSHLNAELLGTVSHKLRSPLAAIKGYAHTLLRHNHRLPREERHEFLSAIDEASARLETIITRLMELSELETEEAILHRDTLDLVPIARSAINAVAERLDFDARPSSTFTLTLCHRDGSPSEREPLIRADARAMYDLLTNLLENAVKYSPQGGEIALTVRPLPDQGATAPFEHVNPSVHARTSAPRSSSGDHEFLEVTIRDHGVGIPPDHLGRIFDRFHRVDTRLTRDVDGLGLGLAICRRLVELHGGAIWAESEPGVGSTFHVLLPIASQADHGADQKEH